jgi:hypothetical protein
MRPGEVFVGQIMIIDRNAYERGERDGTPVGECGLM